MIIKDIETFIVANPSPHTGGRYFIFVKLVTDSGVVGYGEAYATTFGPDVMVRCIEDVAERYLIGEDPHHIEAFWRRAYSSGFSQRPDPTLMACVSALEIACWDIIGKEANKPVYELLGGRVHERLRTYTYLYPENGSVQPSELGDAKTVYNDPDMAAASALAAVNEGFTAVKFDPAGPYTAFDGHQPRLVDIDLSTRMVAAVREAIGTRADILFGTHGQFSPSGAIRMAKALEPYDPLWFEEPVPPDMPEAMSVVAGQTSIPIATGERLCTHYEFARVLQMGAASILQLNLGRSGGILNGKKIAAIAETYHAHIAPHCYCGPIVGAANIQLSTCSPNFLILESIKKWDGFHAELLKSPISWEEGYVIPSTEPGLGVELDEAVARANPWDASGSLHLTMAPDPLSY
ncbi:MAG: isomerase [Hyphomicrobiales bacterium]|nr:MAG: isomerase [Hyphomicrobiales bacterium]